jgi:uncharacterized protein
MARLRVEVVLALAVRQTIIVLQLGEGATAGEAALASGLVSPGGTLQLGIGGRLAGPEEVLRDGDRVEILRPLSADPNEARRRRAHKARKRR